MFGTLRAQLLASYVFVILLTLLVAGLALIAAFVIDAPALRAFEVLRPVERANRAGLPDDAEARDAFLQRIAQVNGIRTLRVSENQTILFDSAGQVEPGHVVALNTVGRRALADGVRVGRLRLDNGTWVFVASPPDELGWSVYAQRVNRGAFVAEFGLSILRPMLQAGTAGSVVAILLAFVISQSVSRPLRLTADAAQHIAEGDYGRQAPLNGPHEVREVARTFNFMAQRVEKNQRAQREFLASVSHDLKTPLTSIQGFAQAIVDDAAPDPQRAAGIIYDEASRMRRMVDALLDLARIESGMAGLSYGPVDLHTLLEGVRHSLQPQAAQQQVDIYCACETAVRVEADGDRLVQVFTNLIDNAVTHARSEVRVSLRVQGDMAVVDVSDDGDGIAAEDQTHIFDRFYQADKARSGGKGSGLGLTIAREIIHAHGGDISLQSGQGTTFRVQLPLNGLRE